MRRYVCMISLIVLSMALSACTVKDGKKVAGQLMDETTTTMVIAEEEYLELETVIYPETVIENENELEESSISDIIINNNILSRKEKIKKVETFLMPYFENGLYYISNPYRIYQDPSIKEEEKNHTIHLYVSDAEQNVIGTIIISGNKNDEDEFFCGFYQIDYLPSEFYLSQNGESLFRVSPDGVERISAPLDEYVDVGGEFQKLVWEDSIYFTNPALEGQTLGAISH